MMLKIPRIPRQVAAFSAGTLLPFGMVLLSLAVVQAFQGGAMVRDAVEAGTISPRSGLVVLLVMAAYLSWHSVKAARGIKLAIWFK